MESGRTSRPFSSIFFYREKKERTGIILCCCPSQSRPYQTAALRKHFLNSPPHSPTPSAALTSSQAPSLGSQDRFPHPSLASASSPASFPAATSAPPALAPSPPASRHRGPRQCTRDQNPCRSWELWLWWRDRIRSGRLVGRLGGWVFSQLWIVGWGGYL